MKKEYNVVDRQANQIKIDTSCIEDDLVTEHFNHHQANRDREVLCKELEQIRKQIEEVNGVLEGYDKEMLLLHQSIRDKDSECDKLVKEYYWYCSAKEK